MVDKTEKDLIISIMSIEFSTYTITPEEEEFYGLNEIDLPDNLFDDLYDVLSFESTENKYNVDLKEICFQVTVSELSKRIGNRSPKYKTYKDRLVIDDGPQKGIHGALSVKCKFCKKHFTPTYKQVDSRVKALNGSGGESNFYCSQECKDKCPVYNTRSKELGIKYKRDQNFIKQANEMALERAEYECEICGEAKNLIVHHIKPFKTHPLSAYDLENLIVLCKKHHKQYGHSDKKCTTGYLAKCEMNE